MDRSKFKRVLADHKPQTGGRAMKREVFAAALSAILPGAGQLYNHHWVKGVVFLAAVLVISAFMRRGMLLAGTMSGVGWLLLLVLFGIVIWSVADAYRAAKTAS
jgi:TM2 domain-containing membrane protein YozV